MKQVQEGITYPKGFIASGIHCGIRKNKTKYDLGLIYCETVCDAANVYTKNKVVGAPIIVTKEHMKKGKAKAIICNSGNANTCNADGVEKANLTCKALSKVLEIAEDEIIIASTGVIGQPLNVDAIINGLPNLAAKLSPEGGTDAALAIMTTDTVMKQAAITFMLNGKEAKIGAIAKGSGMININMATMLSFITTDVNIESKLLQEALSEVTEDTFNMVSVDGDTSTNDMVSVLANGLCENKRITVKNDDYNVFKDALFAVCANISKQIARDGEGATKLIECAVYNAPDKETAKMAAKTVINSSLVKTAIFGADANWGRILCAIGYSGAEVNTDIIDISLLSPKGKILVCENGMGVDFDEDFAKKILLEDSIVIEIDLKSGLCEAKAWGCDLTYDYVRINGDYRT